jgi:hypothetical protein
MAMRARFMLRFDPASRTPLGVTIVIIVRAAQLSGLDSSFISSSPSRDPDRLQRNGM